MNDFDKAGRYLIKRDPAGFFRWLLRRDEVTFHLWIDARRVALPDQNDLTHDLVASFEVGDGFEALAVELQSEGRADTLPRLLEYLARLWADPAPNGLDLSAAGGVVLNLTGGGQPFELRLRPTVAPACRLELSVMQRDLRRDDAADLIADVESGRISPWQLGWVPLLQGGDEPVILQDWKRAAELLPDGRPRADLGMVTLTFATRGQNRPVWDRALRGWNVQTSPLWDEIRAGGREEGRLEVAQAMILRVGRQHFGKAPTRKQQAQLRAIADLGRLERLGDRLLTATSWTDLLSTP